MRDSSNSISSNHTSSNNTNSNTSNNVLLLMTTEIKETASLQTTKDNLSSSNKGKLINNSSSKLLFNKRGNRRLARPDRPVLALVLTCCI